MIYLCSSALVTSSYSTQVTSFEGVLAANSSEEDSTIIHRPQQQATQRNRLQSTPRLLSHIQQKLISIPSTKMSRTNLFGGFRGFYWKSKTLLVQSHSCILSRISSRTTVSGLLGSRSPSRFIYDLRRLEYNL